MSKIAEVRAAFALRFPTEAQLADVYLTENYFDRDAHCMWFERLSQMTTDAMTRREEATVGMHLKVVSDLLALADEEARKIIDACYVESLMWNLDSAGKKWAWALIPPNIRELYVEMWGENAF